jgi:hypothetical protein
MALVQLADVIEPEVYLSYTATNNPETSAFAQSGVAVRNALMAQALREASDTGTIPFWNDLDPDIEPNYSDDSETEATPNKVDAGSMIYRKAYMNQAYKAADLVKELAGSDPMQQIRNRFGTYWERQFNRRIIASLEGILADNIANDSSDMVNDVGTGNDNDNAVLFSRDAFVTAAFTSGDHYDNYVAIAVHSTVYSQMIKNDDIDFIRDSQGTLDIPTFMGRRVIVDDSLPFTPAAGALGTDAAALYTSVLFGPGALSYEMMPADIGVELHREPLQGLGGGTETIIERNHLLLHPLGMSFQSVAIGGQSPSLAELKEAQQWDRVVDRKNIPLAFLTTNG